MKSYVLFFLVLTAANYISGDAVSLVVNFTSSAQCQSCLNNIATPSELSCSVSTLTASNDTDPVTILIESEETCNEITSFEVDGAGTEVLSVTFSSNTSCISCLKSFSTLPNGPTLCRPTRTPKVRQSDSEPFYVQFFDTLKFSTGQISCTNITSIVAESLVNK
eukprot:TRINITY_DN12878_c0_g1_i1.p1 TRINITY_DN12878_c0_g1~~TRINITY_DN12878_c0_g1_i1.p1  ORF type:complete len:164 (-),score=15.88 TRINITY_DN12878_c0_g1_i1:9-500(-)